MGSVTSTLIATRMGPNLVQLGLRVAFRLPPNVINFETNQPRQLSSIPDSSLIPATCERTFTDFSSLPMEIRLRIWEDGVPLAPRILEYNERQDPNDMYTPQYLSIQQADLTLACFESNEAVTRCADKWGEYNIQAISKDREITHFGPEFIMDDFIDYVCDTQTLGSEASAKVLGATKILIIECNFDDRRRRSVVVNGHIPNFIMFAKAMPNLKKVIVALNHGEGGSMDMEGSLKLCKMNMAKNRRGYSSREFVRGFLPISLEMQFRRLMMKKPFELEFMEFEEVGA